MLGSIKAVTWTNKERIANEQRLAKVGLIKAVTWTNEERIANEQRLAKVNAVLRPIAKKEFGKGIKRLRKEFLSGSFTFKGDAKGRAAITDLLRLETEFLAAYIPMASNIAKRFFYINQYRLPLLDVDDYLQEASMAIISAVCGYKGKQRFATYSHWAIRRKLLDLIKTEFGRNAVQLTAEKIRNKIGGEVTLESALDEIKDQDTRVQIRILLSSPVSFDQDWVVGAQKKSSDQAELLKELLPRILPKLSAIQRRLVNNYLSGGKHTDFVHEINPNTQEPYTRAWLQQLFKQACGKIGQELEAA